MLAQELFHAFQTDLNCYSREDMSVRETEGDIVSTNIMYNLNQLDKTSSPSQLHPSCEYIFKSGKYTDKATAMFNENVLSKQFDIDFNKAVNMRIKFYKEEGNAPRSYIQANSNTVAKALKFIIRKIYLK